MNPRTRKSLLARSLSTAIIDEIAKRGDTVGLLRAMPYEKLVAAYGKAISAHIRSAVTRQEIEPNVVDAVLSKSQQCCSLCADGNSTKPFQIHHIAPYADTQDNSEDNLLLVCPTHHVSIHEQGVPAEAQKIARLRWYSIIEVSQAYSAKGLDFPYDAFEATVYVGAPRYVEVISTHRLSPVTARSLADCSVVKQAIDDLRQRRFALLTGKSGSGKTAAAQGVAGIIAETEGRVVISYRPPPPQDRRRAANEIQLFLSTVKRPTILILDDANTFLTVEDLETISRAATELCALIATATDAGANDDKPLEVAFVDRLLRVTWDDLRESVIRHLLEHETEIVPVLRKIRSDTAGEQVGFDALDRSLQSLVWRYSDNANTVWQFFFLLCGSWTRIDEELKTLIDSDRADVPVLYAAIEQIAEVERFVSPEEVEAKIRALPGYQGPAATVAWIREVFEAQAERRRMRESRGSFNTVHRDWARSLISAGLANPRSRESAAALFQRDFDVTTPNPRRLMILWSWFYYDDGAGGRFVYNWASSQPWQNWTTLITTASRTSLTDVALVADRLHLLKNHHHWPQFLGTTYRLLLGPIAHLVSAATASDWWALRRLFMGINRADSAVAHEILCHWPPSSAARAIEDADAVAFDDIEWFLAEIRDHSPEWAAAVGRELEPRKLIAAARKTRPGNVEAAFKAVDLLKHLGAVVTRSLLRDIVECASTVAANASLKDIHYSPGIGDFMFYFPGELKRLLGSFDSARLANDLRPGTPRDWRTLLEIALAFGRFGEAFLRDIIDRLDIDSIVINMETFIEHYGHQIRSFIWLLSYGSEDGRRRLAPRLAASIERILSARPAEREQLLEAFVALDGNVGGQLASRFGVQVGAFAIDRELEDLERLVAGVRAAFDEADGSGTDYDVFGLLNKLLNCLERGH